MTQPYMVEKYKLIITDPDGNEELNKEFKNYRLFYFKTVGINATIFY